MSPLIKRLILSLILASTLFSFTVFAEAELSLSPDGEFYVYGDNTSAVASALKMTETELEAYRSENGIIYLAVNKDNTKQIRISRAETDFSNGVINLSNLSNSKISELIPDITGIEGAKGDIIDLNGQKLIKTVFRSSDSGGDYILTEYITVADKKSYILTFYTDASADTDYIDQTLETLQCSAFLNNTAEKSSGLYYVIAAAAVIFALATAAILVWIVIDIKRGKAESIDFD